MGEFIPHSSWMRDIPDSADHWLHPGEDDKYNVIMTHNVIDMNGR